MARCQRPSFRPTEAVLKFGSRARAWSARGTRGGRREEALSRAPARFEFARPATWKRRASPSHPEGKGQSPQHLAPGVAGPRRRGKHGSSQIPGPERWLLSFSFVKEVWHWSESVDHRKEMGFTLWTEMCPFHFIWTNMLVPPWRLSWKATGSCPARE